MKSEIIKIMPIPYRKDEEKINEIIDYCNINKILIKELPNAIFSSEHKDFFRNACMASLHLGIKSIVFKDNTLIIE